MDLRWEGERERVGGGENNENRGKKKSRDKKGSEKV